MLSHRIPLLGLSLVLGTMIIVYALFLPRRADFDEMVLHNAIHTYLQNGVMTYPAHSAPDFMVIHPPVHYLITAEFMKFGLDLFHAAAMPLILLSLLTLYLIGSGHFSVPAKVGLMLGVFLAAFIWQDPRPVRPDLHLALAWFAGLIALESARLNNWQWQRLILGAFLLAYASGMHYPAAFAWTGALTYALWAWWSQGWRRAGRISTCLLAGGCLFGLPYLTFFVIPNWRAIRDITHHVQGTHGWDAAWNLHRETYRYLLESAIATFDKWDRQAITTALSYPVLWLGVPAGLIGPVLLLSLRSTRGIALAALPHLLFIIFVSSGQGKNRTNTGYYVPEFTILFAGMLAAAGAALQWITARRTLPWAGRVVAWTGVAAAAIVVLVDRPICLNSFGDFRWSTPYQQVSRAAGRAILGTDATVGVAYAGSWYNTGANTLYFITPDLLYPSDISKLDLDHYFTSFDALAFTSSDSSYTLSKQRRNVASSYADETLHLRGFFLHRVYDYATCRPDKAGQSKYPYSASFLDYCLVSKEVNQPLVGFWFDEAHCRLKRFVEDSEGDYSFVALLCGGNQRFDEAPGAHVATFALPASNPGQPASEAIHVGLIPLHALPAVQAACLSSGGKVRQQVRGRLEDVPIDAFQSEMLANDRGVAFPRTFAELKATRVNKVADKQTIDLKEAGGQITKLNSANQPQKLQVRGSPNDLQLVSAAIDAAEGANYLIECDLRVKKGPVYFNVMNGERNRWMAQMIRHRDLGNERIRFVVNSADAKKFVITVGGARYELGNVSIERVWLREHRPNTPFTVTSRE